MDKTKISNLPRTPGVYLFKNKAQEVIYIGKAKVLRARVSSYFKKDREERIAALVPEIADVSVIATKNEAEALLLEAQLISEHQPYFNVLLKDGQPFVYLLFTETNAKNSALPGLEIVRNKKKKGIYFGPFIQKGQARRVHTYLVRTFKLKLCNKKIAAGCLDYHLDLCPGNCRGNFDLEAYRFRLSLARQALEGDHKAFVKTLKAQIALYNAQFLFERARELQGYLTNFEQIFHVIRTRYHERKYESETAIATAPVKYKPTPKPEVAAALQKLLNLPIAPRTIDCFDISHFQSQAIVGSCIRFHDGVPVKDKFRRFRVRTLTQQNDYAALQEVVLRRYRPVGTPFGSGETSARDKNLAFVDLPDLILIDGGKGQLNAVLAILPHNAVCVSLAKREEIVYGPTVPQGIPLDVKKETGKLLIALRDYAHHFAVSYHKVRRSKNFEI